MFQNDLKTKFPGAIALCESLERSESLFVAGVAEYIAREEARMHQEEQVELTINWEIPNDRHTSWFEGTSNENPF